MAKRSNAKASTAIPQRARRAADDCPFADSPGRSTSERTKLDKQDAASPVTQLADYDTVFNALAHEQRRQVLLVLNFRGGEMTAGEIARRFSCTWPTTTRHLRVLEDAGLVVVEKRGRERVYRVNKRRLNAVAGQWLKWFKST